MALTDIAIKNSKPKDTDYNLADEKGLYVLVKKLVSISGWTTALLVKGLFFCAFVGRRTRNG